MARKSNLKTSSLILGVICLLAGFIRFAKLDMLPLSLYWEEVALGYDALSIKETGKDYHGNSFPIVAFPSFGDYKPSLYFYTAAASMFIFGDTDFSVRFPSALAGLVAVLVIFGISRQLLFSTKESLLASLIYAVMPIAIQFSRGAFEVNLGTTLMLLGIWSMLQSRQKPRYLILAVVSFGLSMYTYHGFRLLSPLLALGIYSFERHKYQIKHIVLGVIFAIIVTLPILANIRDKQVNQRFAETSLFPESQAVIKTNELRDYFGNNILSRVVFHRYWWWGGEIVTNYLKNFSPKFLFMKGDENPRHGVSEFGPLYHWQLLAILAGIYGMITTKKPKAKILLVWIVLSPVAVMLTKTNPHTLRMLPVAPALAILSSYGISILIENFKYKKSLVTIMMIWAIVEASMFGHFYVKHYPTLSAADWQYGYKQVVEYVESIKDSHQSIYFTREYGRPSIYVLWYGKYDPKKVQAVEASAKKDQQELLELGKYIFEEKGAYPQNSLVVASPKNIPNQGDKLKTILFPNGQIAFEVYEIP